MFVAKMVNVANSRRAHQQRSPAVGGSSRAARAKSLRPDLRAS